MNWRSVPQYLVIVLVSLIFLAGACGGDTQEGQDRARVAANLPLTGDLATYGEAIQEGAMLYLEEMEGDGNANVDIEVDWQDNAGDPRTAVSIMQKQYLNPPDIYVSGVKPQTMAIIEEVTARGTPHFVYIFDPEINENSDNNFRTWVSYKIEPAEYLAYAERVNAQRIAIVYVQLPHTVEEFEEILIPEFRNRGVTDLLVESFEFGKTDFKDVALKFREFAPDLMILNGFQAELVNLVRALRGLDLIQEGNTLATYDMIDAATILGPDELEGIRVVSPYFVTRAEQDTTISQWIERFQERFGKEPLYTHAFSYDMMKIIADAAERVERPVSNENWIAALKDTYLQGVTGTLRFDEDNDLVTPLEIGVFREGELIPLNPGSTEAIGEESQP